MKKFLIAAVAVCSMVLAMTSPVFANSVVGTWVVADHGQGGWAGGNMLSDGTLDGSGAFAFQTPVGEEVASIQGSNWSFTDSTNTVVNLCVTVTGKMGPAFPVGIPILICAQVPIDGPAPINIGGDTFAKVNFHP